MILLTRPYQDSLDLAKKLGAEKCLIEPMIEIEQLEIDLSKYIENKIQAFVVTSKNVNCYSDITIPEHGKNAEEILDYCLNNLSPDNGKILYLSGNIVTLDIAKELRIDGFDAERVETYKQIAAQEFSDDFLQKIKEIKAATFFSNQTLRNFMQLADKYKIDLSHITCICISEKVATSARQLNWQEVKTAKRANMDGMLDLIAENLA